MDLEHKVVEVVADDKQPLVRNEESLIGIVVKNQVCDFVGFVFGKLLRGPLGIAELVHLSEGESAEGFGPVPVEALLFFDVFVEDGAGGQSVRNHAGVELARDALEVERLLAWQV